MTEAQLESLRKDFRAGLNTIILARKYNVSVRAISIRRMEMYGHDDAVRGRKAKMAEPVKKPMPAPNCIPSITKAQLMGRRA
jgi:hypothetical protein